MILQRYWDGILCRTEAGAADFTSAYDVIVVGLGTAGAVAAIAAARRGLRVLGLERMPAMGGQGTLGYVLPYYFGGRGGLHEELDRKTRQRMKQGFVETNGLHPDCKLFVLEQEAEKAGAEIRCEAALTGVYLEGKSVVGIQWLQSGQFSSARARVVLDCTGEAAVCVLSGCETRVGPALFPSDDDALSGETVLSVCGQRRLQRSGSGGVQPRAGRNHDRIHVSAGSV